MSYLYFMNKYTLFAAFCDYHLFTNCAGASLAKKRGEKKTECSSTPLIPTANQQIPNKR